MTNAKIILLLMVMIASALCSPRDYVITLKSASSKTLHIASDGKVSAADISIAQNITIGSTGDFLTTGIFKITLFSKEVGRYLCFNKHWKLVGMKNLKESCHFIESLDRGYYEFRSAINRSRRVGFTRRFKPVGPQQRQDLADACFHFMRIEAEKFDPNDFHPIRNDGRKSTPSGATTTNKTHNRRNNQRIQKTTNNGHNNTSINNNSNLSQKTNHNNNNSKTLQPKIRHHHDNSSIVARRRHYPKSRQQRKFIQNQDTASSSTNLSAKSSSAMLIVPSVFNIVASVAASQRTRGRRRNTNDLRDGEQQESDDSERTKKQKKSNTSTSSSTIDPPAMYLSPKHPEHRHRHHHHLRHQHHNHIHHQHHQLHHPHHQQGLVSDYDELDKEADNTGLDTGADVDRHHHLPEPEDEQRKPTATSGLKQQFPNEYSNNHNNNNNNYLAIPALPKNLYNNNRMTEYVYSGSTNLNTNYNFNSNFNFNSNSNINLNKNTNTDSDSNNVVNDRTSISGISSSLSSSSSISSSSSSSSSEHEYSKEKKISNNYNIDNNFKHYLNTTKDKDNANRKNLFDAIKNSNNKNKIKKNIVQYRYAVSFISEETNPPIY